MSAVSAKPSSTALWARETPRAVPRAAQTPTPRVALHLGVNFLPVQVQHAQGDGGGQPVNVRDKRDCPDSVSHIRKHFPNDARRSVKELDAKLHGQSRAVPSESRA